MTENQRPSGAAAAPEREFVRGDDRLARLLARPDIADGVARVRADMQAAERQHADSLARIREAGELTQTEVANRLGVGQPVVSRMERRSDMLLSTLADYLHATGATQPRLVVDLNGTEVELSLDRLRANPGSR